MTTIKSGSNSLKIRHEGSHLHVTIDCERAKDKLTLGAFVPTADLLAALDATANTDVVSRDVHRRQIAAVQEERDEWKVDADEWKARAEEAEAEALEQAKLVRTWADRAERATEALASSQDRCNEHVQEAAERAEVAHAKATALAAERDEQRARAEKAEAMVARVQRLRDVSGDTVGVEELDAILNPAPAFTLPTEAGVRFVATHKATGSQSVFKTFDGGTETAYIHNAGTYWVAEDLLRDFEDFRLLGSDQ